ncbi:hypothetical protein BV898_12297 [Hypsibius exemplaris]|uniref:EB domain-containing protein n=1 Tax=Hypsibius exemplaris TaxID=2072580 RepID=A0A1W0WE01_HYPEX|nr:hypothetical protein BV898_12297 [Hypsibius exemplaris]
MEITHVCLIFSLLIFATSHTVSGASKGESCDSTSECADTGLTCSGHRCVCLLDLGRKAAKTWACNTGADCSSINVLAQRTLDITDLKVSREPACFASSVCPNYPGALGYCDVLMAAR